MAMNDGEEDVAQEMESANRDFLQGYEADHRSIELLRLRNFTIGKRLPDEQIVGSHGLEVILQLIGVMVPFVAYLNTVVMPDEDDSDGSDDDENDATATAFDRLSCQVEESAAIAMLILPAFFVDRDYASGQTIWPRSDTATKDIPVLPANTGSHLENVLALLETCASLLQEKQHSLYMRKSKHEGIPAQLLEVRRGERRNTADP
ncbi:hypothetical protein B0A52_06978 [Exophiala mesophila]|uniref:Uncharacterized protein n=1 Tax=Exophiala mesophila TaxID=212818 RepID=A0A438N115_EXOME|nr:hypothetical protein B0A52_06978 [Exophiala mesophila]